MPKDKLSAYVAKTRAYLDTPEGRAASKRNRLALGYSYQADLCAAVMTACHLIVYERISEVVYEIARQDGVEVAA